MIAYAFQSPVKLPSAKKWFWGRYRIAEYACLALCRLSAPAVEGQDWLTFCDPTYKWTTKGRVPLAHTRHPPIPNWRALRNGKRNICPACGQPTFADGAWWPEAGPPRFNREWHACCYTTYTVWRTPNVIGHWFAERQGNVCPVTGEVLTATETLNGFTFHNTAFQVDHTEPLWRVRMNAQRYHWPDVLRFWGVGNLRALSHEGHRRKTAEEAAERARLKAA